MKLSLLSEFFNLKSMEPLRTNASKFSECRLYLFGSRQKYTCVIVDTVYIYRVVGPGLSQAFTHSFMSPAGRSL